MKKAYILVHTTEFGTRDQVKALLDIPEITHWRYDLPNCFYLVSEESAEFLVNALLERNDKKGRFIITELSDNHQGWLPPATWHLLNNKEYRRD